MPIEAYNGRVRGVRDLFHATEGTWVDQQLAVGALLGAIAAVAGPAPANPLPHANTGHFFVSNARGGVGVYDGAGRWLGAVSDPELRQPRGVVAGPRGRLFVADRARSEIFVFAPPDDFNGPVAAVTRFSDPALDRPGGMTLIGGILYVSSFGTDRIVAFNMGGVKVAELADRNLRAPEGIVADWGSLYVTSAVSRDVLKFDRGGKLNKRFGRSELVTPAGITRDAGGRLYVADQRGNKVVVFDTDGKEVARYKHRHLIGPTGLAVDDRGHLFVASSYRNAIVELDASGRHVRTISAGRLSMPDGVAFAPMQTGDLDDDGAVDVNDFMTVVRGWGTCPTGECAGDVNRNREVDFNDLLIVVNNLR